MIQNAIRNLPGQRGTKSEIFDKISDLYGLSLQNQENSVLFKTLSQFLSKYFGKTVSKEYALNTEDRDFEAFQASCDGQQLLSMKFMIISSLLSLPNHKGSTKEIKAKLQELFRPALEGVDWENTLMKSLSRYKGLFLKSDAVYQMLDDEAIDA